MDHHLLICVRTYILAPPNCFFFFVKYITQNLFYQFSIASIIQLILAFVFSSDADVNLWSFRSFAAVVYLAVFGSVIAFFAYYYAFYQVIHRDERQIVN